MGREAERIGSFKEFWPYYLAEHSKPLTRILHLIGTLLGTTLLILAFALSSYLLIVIGLIAGYAFAWFSHFAVEKNKPASFKYPLWSFLADYKMAFMTITGRKF
jgi:hypothetical protein